jgi:hypothetical protein
LSHGQNSKKCSAWFLGWFSFTWYSLGTIGIRALDNLLQTGQRNSPLRGLVSWFWCF